MTVLWERLAGDTSSFAVKLSFAEDPHGGSGVDPSVALTWGSFQFWVDGVNLSTHVDAGETLQSTHWYMLPVLEWLVEQWDALLHEERLPPTSEAYDAASVDPPWSEFIGFDHAVTAHVEQDHEWRGRHAIRSARDGGVFPGVFIRRMRQYVEISWEDSPIAGASDVRHAAPRGRSLQNPTLVATALHTVALEATTWLASRSPTNGRVADLLHSLSSLPERDDEPRIAWLAGLGSTRQAVVSRWREVQELVQDGAADGAGTFLPR